MTSVARSLPPGGYDLAEAEGLRRTDPVRYLISDTLFNISHHFNESDLSLAIALRTSARFVWQSRYDTDRVAYLVGCMTCAEPDELVDLNEELFAHLHDRRL